MLTHTCLYMYLYAQGVKGYKLPGIGKLSTAEGSLIKGLSASRTLSAIAGAYWLQVTLHSAAVWIGRVPSKLNIADGPSRGDLGEVTAHGWAYTAPWLPQVGPWAALLGFQD